MTLASSTAASILPLELVDRCTGHRVHILLRDPHTSFRGTLLGFDDFVNMVLRDVVMETVAPDGEKMRKRVDEMLLNGNNVCMIAPEDPTAVLHGESHTDS